MEALGLPNILNRLIQKDRIVRGAVAGYDALSEAKTQALLDELDTRGLSREHLEWYLIDVSTIMGDTSLLSHEVDECDRALLFFKESLVHCIPETGSIRHFPRHLVHCFVDDYRVQNKPEDPDVLMRAELFSITPHGEQLSWVRECISHQEIPQAQQSIAQWMSWLNR